MLVNFNEIFVQKIWSSGFSFPLSFSVENGLNSLNGTKFELKTQAMRIKNLCVHVKCWILSEVLKKKGK